MPVAGGNCNFGVAGRDEHPVNCVRWEDAKAFAAHVGGRLATESEWEYAARGGDATRDYPWGDRRASCAEAVMDDGGRPGCGARGTASVCSRHPAGSTPQGVCDLAGNVAEWVEDRYRFGYDAAPRDGTAFDSVTDLDRVLRGGSWRGGPQAVRAASRAHASPARDVPVRDDVGIRVVRTR
jgi:formylglycine-generating enzyme required for sulfatase activity